MSTLKFLAFGILLTQIACGGDTPEDPNKPDVQKPEVVKPQPGFMLEKRLVDRVPPKEILVSLLSFFDEQVQKKIDEAYSESQIKEIKSKIMTHDLTIESVQNYLQELKKKPDLASHADGYLKMITKKPLYKKLWVDFYGRIFDSVFVNEFVKNPPPEIRTALTGMSKSIGENLKWVYNKMDPKDKKELDKQLHFLISQLDFRFWFPEVAVLNAIKNNPSDIGTAQKIIDFLSKNKVSGFELISVPYLTTKVGNILKEFKAYVPGYITAGDKIYKPYMAPFINKIRGHLLPSGSLPDKELYSKAAGLTLLGQPIIVTMPSFIDSQRPTVERFPKFDATNAPAETFFALRNQLRHGVVWASGMSGSTNIDMHAWNWVKNNPIPTLKKNIDPKAAFLGTIMFLVYDGGHSINEPLWAMSVIESINPKFGTNFNLTDKKAIKDFVPNFEKFRAIYNNTSLQDRVQDAFEKAFEEVIKNFRKYGHKEFDIKNMPSNNIWNKIDPFGNN
jgi:hypothetical protein